MKLIIALIQPHKLEDFKKLCLMQINIKWLYSLH